MVSEWLAPTATEVTQDAQPKNIDVQLMLMFIMWQ